MELGVKLASIFFSMILVNNYVLVKFLGICPFLGVSKKLDSAVGMSCAVIFVMVLATLVTFPIQIFLLDANDLGYLQTIVFILIIAVLVQLIEIILKKYMPPLYNSLGVYLPLIVVNCIILGRAEMFANKNTVIDSALDGIGMGLGFTLTLTIMGSIREILGSGTWMSGLGSLIPALGSDFAIRVIPESIDSFSLMTSAPGGFFMFGVMMAGATWLTSRPKKNKPAAAEEGGAEGWL